jgi:hypothetical protein
MSDFKPYDGNLSKAHKRIKQTDKVKLHPDDIDGRWKREVAVGFLHVFIELTAQARDYVKYQVKKTG